MPFVRGHRSVFPRTPRNTGVYTRHPTFGTATSGVLTRLPAKLSKNGMRVYTLSDRRSKKIACLNGLRSEGVKYRYRKNTPIRKTCVIKLRQCSYAHQLCLYTSTAHITIHINCINCINLLQCNIVAMYQYLPNLQGFSILLRKYSPPIPTNAFPMRMRKQFC